MAGRPIVSRRMKGVAGERFPQDCRGCGGGLERGPGDRSAVRSAVIGRRRVLRRPSHSGSSPGDAILINTAEDLQCLHDSPSDWGKSFMQTADIDMMGTTWTTGIGVSQESSFYGQYSGGGFENSNLTLTTGATSGSFGLFG